VSDALPPIDQALVPAAVRAGGADAVKRYDAALSFEGVLDEQLAQALTQSVQLGDDSSADPATSMTLQLLPQSLAKGLVADGGTGLAMQLYQSLGGTEASA